MAGPIDVVYIDGVPVLKSVVRADDKTGKRRNMASVDDVRNAHLSGQFAGIYVRTLQANFDLDTGDAPTADDGSTCIVDLDGNRFKVVSSAGTINDISAVVGSAESHWSEYYGNPGTGRVSRLNRLLVGEASLGSSDIPMSTPVWLDDEIGDVIALSQLASVSTVGGHAVTGATRTSDYRDWSGSTSGGSQAGTFIARNDDLTPATTPIAAAVVGIGIHDLGCNGITLNQFDINNAGAVIDATPFSGVTSGSQYALGLTSGAYASIATADVTAALYVAAGRSGGPVFRKGILFFEDAVDPSVGAGGNGVAIEMARNQSIRWLNSGGATDAEFYAAATGAVFLNDLHATNFAAGTLGSAAALFHGVRSTNGPERVIIQNGNTGASAYAGFDAAADVGTLALRVNSVANGDNAIIDTDATNGIRISSRNAAGFVSIRANSPTVEVARFTANGRMGLGTTAPTSLLTVSANVTAPQSPLSGTNIHFSGADTSSLVMCSDSFAGSFSFSSRRANGTAASKTAVASGNFLMQFNAYGYDGANYGVGAAMRAQATENFTSIAQGAIMSIYTTAIGSIVNAETARFDKPTTATYTGLSIWDNDNGALERVTVGAADSGGSGFKVLRIAN